MGWLRNNNSASAIVFVHGLWLFDHAPWRIGNGVSWPQIAVDDPKLAGHDIYQFDYLSGFSSKNYTPEKVVSTLSTAMERDLMPTRRRLIFVCHSLGGILVRRWLVQNDARLTKAGKEIDLLLVASPSLGSPYASSFRAWMAKRAGLEHVSVLFKTGRDGWLDQLDQDFLKLIRRTSPRLELRGHELQEQVSAFGKWLPLIVEPASAGRYFDKALMITGSDHFTIACPVDRDAPQHHALLDLIAGEVVQAPAVATVRMTGVATVDEESLEEFLSAVGQGARKSAIEWPEASTEAIDVLDQVMKRLDSKAIGLLGGDYFAKEGSAVLFNARKERRDIAERLLGYVHRCAALPQGDLRKAIRSYLVLGHYRAHGLVFKLCTWDQLAKLNLTVPQSVKFYDHTAGTAANYAKILDVTVTSVHRGRLTRIGEHPISEGGSYFYVWGPNYALDGYGARCDWGYESVAKWFIPQCELALPADALPEVYGQPFVFSVIKGSDDRELQDLSVTNPDNQSVRRRVPDRGSAPDTGP